MHLFSTMCRLVGLRPRARLLRDSLEGPLFATAVAPKARRHTAWSMHAALLEER